MVLGGIVKIKNRRKGIRRGNAASPEKVVSKVWVTQAGARRLGGNRGAHPRHKSPARAWTARVSSRETARLAPLQVPQVSASISAWRAGGLSPRRPPRTEANGPEDAPAPVAGRPGPG